MNTKLEIINESISEIRDILGADCANVSELPELVRALSENASKSGFSTVFVFSSFNTPEVPTAYSMNTSTGLVENLNEEGSQLGFKSSIARTTNSNNVEEQGFTGMSFAVFDCNGKRVTKGSTPTNLRGERGRDGKMGADGPAGAPGIPGEKGDPGKSYRTISAYTTTDSTSDIPLTPRGGHWDMKTNTATAPMSEDGTVGYLNVDEESHPKKFIGTSSATFNEDGDPIGQGSTPFRMTGDDGKSGSDGRTIEFIYRLLPDYDTFLKLYKHLNTNKLESIDEPDYIPEINDTICPETEGTDRPSGISSLGQVEVSCSRIRNNIDSPGGEGSDCAVGSHGGEDGMDGDGIEYIYLVTPSETNGIKITADYVREYFTPSYSISDLKYQQDEFCFNDEGGFPGYDGTDEPSDVGPGKPMEWVMVRKQKNGQWMEFSDPSLGATYSENGVSYITSFVFARASLENKPDSPQGGSYLKPIPNGSIGKDTVPSSDNTLPVGMSSRTFCSNEEYSDDDWSDPKMLADTPDFQVEYSADLHVSGDKIDLFTGNESAGRQSQYEKYSITGGDDSEITDPRGMITASRHGGVGTPWTLAKIKGEKGDKGDPGASVKIEYKVTTKQELLDQGNSYTNGNAFFNSKEPLIGGEGVYVEEEGLLYIYSGGFSLGETPEFDNYWTSVEIKGEPGDSAYLYIAYCEELLSTAKLYFNEPKNYIGVAYSTTALSEQEKNSGNTYEWMQGKGEDGGGQEQVFLLTSKDLGFDPETNHLPLPTDNKTTAEYLPAHGYGNKAYPSDKGNDTPMSPTETYPYCGVATRKGQGGSFGNWIGYDNKASLYSRYSYDGVSKVHIDLSNDLAVIPMEEGKIDPDFKGPVTTVVRVYVGDEQVPSNNFTISGNNVTVNGPEVTLNLSSINENIIEIPLKIQFNNKEYEINGKLFHTDTAYELIPNTYVLKRYVTGELIGRLSESRLIVEIGKGSENKGIASNVPVFAEITYLNGTVEILSTSDGSVTVSNGLATINLNDIVDAASLKIYVVQSDSNGEYFSNGNILSFEDISIVSDGLPGSDGGRTVFVYTVSKSFNDYINAPQGGNLNKATNVVENIISTDGYTWTMNPPIKTGDYRFIGQSVGQFNGEGTLSYSGTQPVCITGEDGVDGKDGNSVEFIYRLLPDTSAYLKLKEYLSKKPLPITDTDVIPDAEDNVATTEGTDDPSGIDDKNYRVEVVCSRKATIDDNGNKVGGKGSKPSLGSMWGEDGKDGPGLEYIFVVTAPDINADILYNELVACFNDKDYQNDDFYPNKDNGYPNSDGTDEPQDVDENQPLEGVSIRKKINGEGGLFSKPTIGGKYAENGRAYKTSYVFTRSIEPPTKNPEGGYGEKPEPNLVDGVKIGHDTIPISGEGAVGMSYRMFRDDDVVVDYGSNPVQLTDTSDFEVIYGVETASLDPKKLPSPPFEGDENGYNGGYDDAVTGNVYGYMATATCHNNVGSNWTISKIKGEQGPPGDNGTSVTIKGTFVNVDSLREAYNKYMNGQADQSGFNLPLRVGDGYLIDGDLGVGDGDGDFDDAGINVGRIQGEPGLSTYLYVGYRDSLTDSEVKIDGSVGKYIGIKVSTEEIAIDERRLPKTYDSGSKGQGDDGGGGEQVFISTQTYMAPCIESSDSELSEEDLINKGWSDKPISVDDNENQYIGYLFRKSNSTGKGTVEKDNKIYAALYDRWSSDGQDALVFELSDDQIVVPIEKDGTVDVDYAGTLENSKTMTITLSLYKGASELPHSEVEYSSNQSSFVSINNNVATINLANLASVDKIIFSAKHNGKTRTKTCHIIKTANAYELSSDTIVIRRGKDGFPERGVTFYPKKGNGQTGSNCAGETLNFTYSYVNGTTDFGEMSINGDTVNGPLNLKSPKFENLTNIHAYMTIGGYEVFEDVAVVADGLDGDSGELEEKVTEIVLNAAQENINTAIGNLQKEIEDAETRLQAALESGIESEIVAATVTLATKTEVSDAIKDLKETYFDEDGKLVNGALNETDIYRLSLAALGKKAEDLPGFNPDTDLAADSIYAQTVNGIIGTFMELNASQIVADNINGGSFSGLSVYSHNTYEDSSWAIEKSGKGKLAGGKINGDDSGKLEVEAASIKGTLSADAIEANSITVGKLKYEGGLLSNGGTNQVNKIMVGSKEEFESTTDKNVLFIVI